MNLIMWTTRFSSRVVIAQQQLQNASNHQHTILNKPRKFGSLGSRTNWGTSIIDPQTMEVSVKYIFLWRIISGIAIAIICGRRWFSIKMKGPVQSKFTCIRICNELNVECYPKQKLRCYLLYLILELYYSTHCPLAIVIVLSVVSDKDEGDICSHSMKCYIMSDIFSDMNVHKLELLVVLKLNWRKSISCWLDGDFIPSLRLLMRYEVCGWPDGWWN